MIHRTTEYTVLTNPSISLSPTLWSYTYFIIVSRRIHCFEAHAPFKNTRVCMYVCIYTYECTNISMQTRECLHLYFAWEEKNSSSRGKLTQVRARRGRFLGRSSERRLCSRGFFQRVFGPWIGATTRACAIHALPLCIPVEHSFASQ